MSEGLWELGHAQRMTDARGSVIQWSAARTDLRPLTSVLCLSGVWYFRKMERTFADVI